MHCRRLYAHAHSLLIKTTSTQIYRLEVASHLLFDSEQWPAQKVS